MKRHELFMFFLCSVALIPISPEKFIPFILIFTLITGTLYFYRFQSAKELFLGGLIAFILPFTVKHFEKEKEIVIWIKDYGDNYHVAITSKHRYIPLKNQDVNVGDIVSGKKFLPNESLKAEILRLRKELYENGEKKIDFPISAVCGAITLGIRYEIPASIKSYMALNGTYHLLAISGLHIGIILSAAAFILKLLKTRKPWSKAAILILPLLPLTGFSPSVVRSYIFLSLLSIGMENYRKVSPLYLLGVAMLITILLNKFNLSAVLSFLAVLGIITTLTENENRILKTIKISLAPMLFTLPVILYQFGTVNVTSFLTSIVAEFLFTPFLIATFISNLTGWHFDFLNQLTEFLGFTFLKLEQVLLLFSKNFVIHSKIPLIASATTLLITLLLIIFEKQKFQLIPATLLLIFTIITPHPITGKTLEIPGWKLNSFFFLSTEGQKYDNCKIISNYVFPYTREILYKNILIDKRVKGREPPTHKQFKQQDKQIQVFPRKV